MWVLWLFGVACCATGLLLWNRIGTAFGLGEAEGKVPNWAVWTSAVALAALCLVLSLLSERM